MIFLPLDIPVDPELAGLSIEELEGRLKEAVEESVELSNSLTQVRERMLKIKHALDHARYEANQTAEGEN